MGAAYIDCCRSDIGRSQVIPMKLFEWLDAWKNGLVSGLTKPITDLQGAIAGKLIEAATGIMESNEKAMKPVTDKVFAKFLDNKAIPKEYREALMSIKKSENQSDYPLQLLMIIGACLGAVMAAGAPGNLEMQREAFKLYPGLRLQANEAVLASWRGLIDDKTLNDQLDRLGMNQAHKDVIQGISAFYPAPQDFIRFAVRDTFNDVVVKKYGYDNDYPANIDAYVKKAGMSPEWLKHYWRAHWELPSPTQMYEMLHRGKITMDDARTLLRIADIAPAFIEPMLAISYNPYTRVDVRRMWDSGILSRDQVKRAYMDGGYDDEHAENLTKWTVADGMKEEADLTKAEIKSALAAGEITEADAITAFKRLGYDDQESEIIVALALYSSEKALRTREKNIFVKQFAKGQITLTALEKGLESLLMSDREMKITIAEAKLQAKETKVT